MALFGTLGTARRGLELWDVVRVLLQLLLLRNRLVWFCISGDFDYELYFLSFVIESFIYFPL